MERRYEEELDARIEKAVHYGLSKIDRWELSLWFNAARIGKTVWRGLHDRFQEQAKAANQKSSLWLYEGALDSVFLINSAGLVQAKDKMGDVA